MQAVVRVLAASASGEDRALALPTEGGYLVSVADGAGGTGNGAAAADRLIAFISRLADRAVTADWFDALCSFDDELSGRLSGGETTGAVAFATAERIVGASVGDSAPWLISPVGEFRDLTANQRRKPLLGSGEALPVVFEAERGGGRLLLGSDGLFKYATAETIVALAARTSVAEAADALAHCVRLPSGGTGLRVSATYGHLIRSGADRSASL